VRARRDAVRLAERDHLGRLVEDVLLERVDDGAVARELEGRLDLVDRRAVGGVEVAAVRATQGQGRAARGLARGGGGGALVEAEGADEALVDELLRLSPEVREAS